MSNHSSSHQVLAGGRTWLTSGHGHQLTAKTSAIPRSAAGPERGPEDDEGEYEDDEDDAEQGSAGEVMFDENLEIILEAVVKVFRKYSAVAIRAGREILPPAISTELIAFGVRGALCISMLWVVKTLLQVFCSVATLVFLGLLIVRLAWSLMVSAQPREASWFPQGD